jgi:hypothetical protein
MIKNIAAALLLLGSASAVTADELPKLFLATWCSVDYQSGEQTYETYETCASNQELNDSFLRVKRSALEAHETWCHYLSIKRTGKTTAPHTQALKSEMVPVMNVVVRCHGEGSNKTWIEQLEMSYNKATLFVKRRTRT